MQDQTHHFTFHCVNQYAVEIAIASSLQWKRSVLITYHQGFIWGGGGGGGGAGEASPPPPLEG